MPTTKKLLKPNDRKGWPAHVWQVVVPWALFALLSALGVVFGLVGTKTSTSITYEDPFFCTPNGNVKRLLDRYHEIDYNEHWDATLFLSITIAIGRMSFTAAKSLDILWDLCVGRGGQALIGWLVYKIAKRSLMTGMESEAMSMPVYTATAFDKWSLTSMWVTLRQGFKTSHNGLGHSRSHRWRLSGKQRVVAFILAGVYVVSFPTILSAMSGYQATFAPVVRLPSTGELMPTANLSLARYSLVDGHRANLNDGYVVSENDPDFDLYNTYYGGSYYFRQLIEDGYFLNMTDNQTWSWSSTNQSGYGNASVTFYLPPLATITTYIDSSSALSFANGSVLKVSAPPLNITEIYDVAWYTGQTILSNSWLDSNSLCLPLNTYQWGFSSLLLFCFCIFTILFSLLLAALQQDVYWYSRTSRNKLWHTNTYRESLILVRAMEDQLVGDLETMAPDELEKEVMIRRCTVGVNAEGLPLSRAQEWMTKHRRDTNVLHVQAKNGPNNQRPLHRHDDEEEIQAMVDGDVESIALTELTRMTRETVAEASSAHDHS